MHFIVMDLSQTLIRSLYFGLRIGMDGKNIILVFSSKFMISTRSRVISSPLILEFRVKSIASFDRTSLEGSI